MQLVRAAELAVAQGRAVPHAVQCSCTEYSEYLVLYHGSRALSGILWESKWSWLKAAESLLSC